MTPAIRAVALTALLSAFCTSCALAQGNSVNTIKSCDHATRIVANGHPAHKENAALSFLARCSTVGASAIATVMAQSRQEQNVADLSEFYYYTVDDWRDSSIMSMAMQLAQDPGASIPTRVLAMHHLLKLIWRSRVFGYDMMIKDKDASGASDPSCDTGLVSDESGGSTGRPLPSNYRFQIEGVLRQLSTDMSAPRQVRNAAACVDW